MHYRVNVVVLESCKRDLWISDVPVHELEVRSIIQCGSVVSGRTVVEFVERDDVVLWVLQSEVSHDIGCDESSTSSDEDVLGVLPNL